MSYPYYYPYYSARHIDQSSAIQNEVKLANIHYNSQLREQQQFENAVRRKEELINIQRLKQYEEQLRNKQRINYILQSHRLEEEYSNSIVRQKFIDEEVEHKTYLRRMQILREERYQLQKQRQQTYFIQRERVARSLQQKQNEMRIAQYQQELLSKINGNGDKNKHKSVIAVNDNDARKLNQTATFAPNFSENKAINRSIMNKKQINNNFDKIKQCRFSNPVIQRNIKEGSKFKIDSNQNQNQIKYNTIDYQNKSNQNHQTIDVNNSIIDKQIFQKSKFLTDRKTQRKLNANTILKKGKNGNHFAKKGRSQSAIDGTYRTIEDAKTPHSNAFKRIQNRLKLSLIVFKDSVLRNTKYQIQHLHNTYESQNKIRQDVKNKINNNPVILKKHDMVVGPK